MQVIELKPSLQDLLNLVTRDITCIDIVYHGQGVHGYIIIQTPEFQIQLVNAAELYYNFKNCRAGCTHELVEITTRDELELHPICILKCFVSDYDAITDKTKIDYVNKEVKKFVESQHVYLALSFSRGDKYLEYLGRRVPNGDIQIIPCDACISGSEECVNCKQIIYTKEMAYDLIRPYMEEYEDKTGVLNNLIERTFPKPPMTKATK